MSFETVKVSNATIKVAKTETQKLPVKGFDWFPIVYSNIFLLAKKQSGKTTVIENILEHCAGKNTKFIFIVSTINKDASWIRIVKHWEDKGHDVLTYDDIIDEEGVNVIQEFLETQKEPPAEIKEVKQEQKGGYKFIIPPAINLPPVVQQGGQPKPKKQKVLYPEYIIVCDDLGKSMRDKYLNQLLKTNRHYKTKVILSAQNLNDLMPEAIKNLDYVLAFGRVPDENMEKLREDLLIDLEPTEFHKMYKHATSTPHQFFYIGRPPGGDVFRKGFNDQYK